MIDAAFLPRIMASVVLLLTCITLSPTEAWAKDGLFPFSACHLERESTGMVTCKLNDTLVLPSSFEAKNWTAFAAVPPNCDSQRLIGAGMRVLGSAELKCAVVQEASELKRPVLFLHFDVQNDKCGHELPLESDYKLELFAQSLVEGSPSKPVTDLSPLERKQALLSSKWLDYESPEFQKWLTKNHLRFTNRQTDIEFAWRVFEVIRSRFHYRYDEGQNRSLSNLVQGDWGDCGGFCGLLVGALRANQIPARMLIGKWAKSDEVQRIAGDCGQCHVKAEFYAEKIGWVPVEMSRAVGFKYMPATKYFGCSEGDFVTLHIDPDLILDTGMFGSQSVYGLQNSGVWFQGEGGDFNKFTRSFHWLVHRN